MSNSSLREQALESFGPILIKVGYEWVDMEAVADAAGLESTELGTQFSSKALFCDAWMEETEDRSRRHHEALLTSGNSSRQVIDDYFQFRQTKRGFDGSHDLPNRRINSHADTFCGRRFLQDRELAL